MSNLEFIPLSELAAVRSGGGAPQDRDAFSNQGHPFVRAGSLSGLLNGSSEYELEKITPDVARSYRLQLFPAGTVLFAKSGMSATKGHVYSLKEPAYVVSHLAALVPHDVRDSGFLTYALRRFSPTLLIRDQAYPSIRLGDIEAMEILAPRSIGERWRIATILNLADGLRRKHQRTIELFDALFESTFVDMFGDPKVNPKGWVVRRLGDIANLCSGNSLPSGQPFVGQSDGYLLLKVSDLNKEGNEETVVSAAAWSPDPGAKSGTCNGNAIVFPKRGGAIATNKKRKILRPAILDPNLMAVEPIRSEVTIDYLFTWFQRFRLEDIASGTTVPQLNKQDLAPLSIAVPPLELQAKFVAMVQTIRSRRASATIAAAKANLLFSSLQHQAFTGQL